MQVDVEKAILIFNHFKTAQKTPYFHPYYIESDAKRDKTLQPVFFVYEEDDSVFYHGFHMAPIEGTDFYDIQSPYGYGGPIASTGDLAFLNKAWLTYSKWCNENNILAEFIRFHPLLENWQYFNGEVIDDRQTVWIDLNFDDIQAVYRTLTKRKIKKAKKNGIIVECWERKKFQKVFSGLYNALMDELRADKFYFFPDTYYQALIDWESSQLLVCNYENEIVAAAIFLINDYYIEYHLGASNTKGKELGAMHLLIHEAALHGQGLGCKVMNLGGGTDDRPDNSLLFFKSGFSPLRSFFKIGRQVYNVQAYNQMKTEWQNKHGILTDRILFYR